MTSAAELFGSVFGTNDRPKPGGSKDGLMSSVVSAFADACGALLGVNHGCCYR